MRSRERRHIPAQDQLLVRDNTAVKAMAALYSGPRSKR